MGVRIWEVKCEKLMWKERKRGGKLQGGGSPALCDVTLSRAPPPQPGVNVPKLTLF